MKKKTLGILTFNRALNYGAVLQALALKDVCEDLGYEVHIVNYLKDTPEQNVSPFRAFVAAENKKAAAFKLIRSMMSYPSDSKRRKAFESFREKHLDESPVCTTAEEVAALGYDFYIAGSDQIWNYNITGGTFDPVYFGQIPCDARCIVYAGSAQDTPFPLDKELAFRAMFERVSCPISIRENKLANYVGKLTDTRYPVVLDPTLLAGRSFIDKLPQYKKSSEPYILIYQIDSNPATDVSVKNLEKRFGCKVYTMTTPRLGSVHGRKGEAGPEEFLTLLRNAEFLVTNSFHGIALSLLLEKNFYVYDNGGVMTRIDSLLSAVCLNDRKIKMVSDIDPEKKISYAPVQKCLAAMRTSSRKFLIDALEGVDGSAPITAHPKVAPLPMHKRAKQDCSGCSACADVCPVCAIIMKADREGFLYPEIDARKCIHCGKCDRVCGFTPKETAEHGHELPRAYGIKHKDEATRLTSRSGAAFIAFSDYVLDQGGVIYGAAMQKDFSVRHIRAESKEIRDLMKGAKYVQSDVTGIYPQVAKDLSDGRSVLFSGTPCQVSGLHAMLDAKKIPTENLICCDLVCHGTPSPAIWKDYIAFIEKKHGSAVEQANFRDKSFGWDSHCESFILANGKKVVSRDYTDLFYDHIMMRPSCHNCHFANVNRVADITLADFWGIEKNDASFNDNKGVSLVLVSSVKGAEILEKVKDQLLWFECDIKNCIQPTLTKPTLASGRREQFWKEYSEMAFSAFLKKYTKPLTSVGRVKRSIKQFLYAIGARKHP